MKAKRILAGLVLSFCVVVLSAQQEKQTFDEYRKEMLISMILIGGMCSKGILNI